MIALRHQSPTTPQRPEPLPSHTARDLTAGGTQAQIELDGQIYTLRITRAGKLILTK
jgi:hemin uptake protein HemP